MMCWVVNTFVLSLIFLFLLMNSYKFLFQTSYEKIAIGINLIGEADIDVDSEPLLPSLECDRVCSVFFMARMFIIVLIFLIYLLLDSNENEYRPLLKLKCN